MTRVKWAQRQEEHPLEDAGVSSFEEYINVNKGRRLSFREIEKEYPADYLYHMLEKANQGRAKERRPLIVGSPIKK